MPTPRDQALKYGTKVLPDMPYDCQAGVPTGTAGGSAGPYKDPAVEYHIKEGGSPQAQPTPFKKLK